MYTGSWYEGEVHVLFKDSAFEPSSPPRYSAEFFNLVEEKAVRNPRVFMYTDGGPDHRLTYTSVKLTLVELFRKLDLDYLCAARTAPHHSYRNSCERVMSILNLGLQSVGLARIKMRKIWFKRGRSLKLIHLQPAWRPPPRGVSSASPPPTQRGSAHREETRTRG